MKAIRILLKTSILLCISINTILAQESLYSPLEFQNAYNNKTRSPDGAPGKNYWQNSATYDIQAEVFPELNLLRGSEQVVYSNNSPDTLHSITLQLHQDMYKKGNPRDRYIHPSDVTEGMILFEMKIGNEDIDLNINKRIQREKSLLKINLNKPILPGNSITFSLGWEFHIPEKTFIRFGEYDSTSFFIAYWFPRIAVYDDILGWDRFGYDGDHEVNNDYADFYVKIKVPGNYYIWSTGELQNLHEVLSEEIIQKIDLALENGKLAHIIDKENIGHSQEKKETSEWIFKSNHVNDFAFGISNHHLWDALAVSLKNGKQVLINVVSHPDSKEYFDVMPEFLGKCIKYYSEDRISIPYPFKTYTAFNGLNRGWHSAMEFPSFGNYSCNTEDTIKNYANFTHELAHNYFPFYVNINQTQFTYLDEGIVTFLEYNACRNVLGLEKFSVWDSINPLDIGSGKFFDVPVFIPSILYHKNVTGTLTSYDRPAFALFMLENLLGKDLFNTCLKEFIIRWHGKRPIPHDLFYTFNDVAKENLNWFWKPWFFEFAYPDLAIENLINNEVTIENIGGLPVPIYLRITYEDNSMKEINNTARIWENGDSKVKIKLSNSKQIKTINLNDIYFIPDVNRSNNSYIYKN